MEIQDTGYIIQIKKFSEKDAIISIFSANYGIRNGMIKNFQSTKNRSHVIKSNLVNFTWKARLEEHLGNFSLDLIEQYSYKVFNNKSKTYAVLAILDICSQVIPERISEKNLYNKLQNFFNQLHESNELYILKLILDFELNLLADLGFGLDLKTCAVSNSTKDLYYISPKSGKAVTFEIGHQYENSLFKLTEYFKNNDTTKMIDILDSLKITEYFLMKFLLKPKNLDISIYRKKIYSSFNK